MRSGSRLLLLSAAALILLLEGCPSRPRGPQAAAPVKVAPVTQLQRHLGRPFDVAPGESVLSILALRGGTLAKVGHNHVIASHDVSGTFYVPDDPAQTTFELRIPVGQLAVDEPDLRAKEGPDFPGEVPDSAKEGTRRNMLSEALLDGAEYPYITLVGQHIDAHGSQALANVLMSVRGQTHSVSVPVVYSLENGTITASGELPLRQTELGLTPFTAMLGALAVQDEMRVRFHFVAHESRINGS